MVCLIVIMLLILIGCYAMWDSHQVFRAADAARYEIYKPAEASEESSFEDLQTLNPDVFAWLTVYGTRIDYPVVQGADNVKYVNTDAKGEYSLSGAIFLDYRSRADFSDFNSFLYGHHMEKEAMFGQIGLFADQDYFNAREHGMLYYAGREHGIDFFAFLHADAYDGEIYRAPIKEPEERQAYLELLLASALHTRDIRVTASDRMILLSTCSDASTNGRDILVGKITNAYYEDPFFTEAAETPKIIQAIDRLPGLWSQIPGRYKLVLIGLLFILLLILLFFAVKRPRRAKHTGKLPAAFLLFLAIWGFTAFNAQAAEKGETAFRVQQTWFSGGSAPAAERTVAYRMTPKQPDSPMPAGSGRNGYAFSLTDTDALETEPIRFEKPGIYVYEIRRTSFLRPGCTADRDVHTVEVHVEHDLGMTVLVYGDNGMKTAAIVYGYTDEWTMRPSDPALMTDPPVVKTVTGHPDSDSVFIFQLTAGSMSNPMPEGSLNGVKTIEIEGSGAAEFGVWSYTREGVYYYTVSEVDTGLNGYLFDTEVYTLTDSVRNVDGHLTVNRVVTNHARKKVGTLAFENRYTGIGTDSPNTGDDSDILLHNILMCVAGGAALGSAAGLIRTGKSYGRIMK
jgi:sortase B